MKTPFNTFNKAIILFCLLLSITGGFAFKTTQDSTLATLDSSIKELSKSIKTLESRIPAASTDTSRTKEPAACHLQNGLSIESVLIVTPILLFLITAVFLLRRLKREGFTFADALSTFRPETTTTFSTIRGAEGNPTTDKVEKTQDKQIRSTSRLMAFITGLTALIIGTCLTSYVGYLSISGCGRDFNIDGLWKILVSIGIGVIPYGINVFNGNRKEEGQKPNKTHA
ncbi:MAG: hypothetical protein LCH51_03310 [Bacteroidetes bacterium]|nr:hypothetical protein [Bacteroidota bacterium]